MLSNSFLLFVGKTNAPYIAIIIIILPLLSALLIPSLGEACFETITMSFLNFTILAHYFLFLISIYALVFPYVGLIIIYILRNYYFPKEFKGFIRFNRRQFNQSYYHSIDNQSTASSSRPTIRSWLSLFVPSSRKQYITVARLSCYRVFYESLNGFIQFLYYFMFFLIRPDTIYAYYRNLWFPIKEPKWLRWKSMNVPRKMHGMMSDDIIYTPYLHNDSAKKLPERKIEINLTNNSRQHDLLDIPPSIRNMRKSKDWVETWNKLKVIDKDDDNYMSRLMKRILLGSSSKATVNIIPLGIIQQSELLQNANYSTAKSSKNSWFSKREKYMNNDSAIDADNKEVDDIDNDGNIELHNNVSSDISPLHKHQSIQLSHSRKFRDDYFKNNDVSDILVTVLNYYRNQFLDGLIENISENDRIVLSKISSIKELSHYNGMINIQDLSLMLDDLLMYYHPNDKSLNAKEKMTIINEFNLWLKEKNIKFVKSNAYDDDDHEHSYSFSNNNYFNEYFNQYNEFINTENKSSDNDTMTIKRRHKTNDNIQTKFHVKKYYQPYCDLSKESGSVDLLRICNYNSIVLQKNNLEANIPCNSFFRWFQHIILKV